MIVLDSKPSQLRRGTLPGDQGVWVFVLIDMTFFALLFVAYIAQQLQNRELFAQSQNSLNVGLGLLNTIVLLTSSWFVALSVVAKRDENQRAVRISLNLAIACGGIFVLSKAVEYGAEIQSGVSLVTNDFYLFYFVITGLHLIHVVAGTVMLYVMAKKARSAAMTPIRLVTLESGATFWHMVDFLWVMIFPLLYLVRWR
ncbi:cytochrome c oxidase subunit 3 family protein [Mycolicibacterium sp. CBMA 226]|uniref:cytochrome c oxidase subunit 3 family protein n=1 Tax=Mycolicibacterium sp. CBMA 226 TaxID=2606611 RepID=UPI0028BEDA16|nr:cytochrome c oxidase subunit 3 family protein [Mycolicibacterium sp. CBMA 226]